jgi:hypothetical protein
MKLVERGAHGVVYEGVNESAVDDVMQNDPGISSGDQDFSRYNHAVVRNAREFFLRSPVRRWVVPVEQLLEWAHG